MVIVMRRWDEKNVYAANKGYRWTIVIVFDTWFHFTSLQRCLVSVMTSVEEEKLNTNNSINPAVGVASATGCSTFISFFATAL